jgi:hypothetical protein
MARSKSTPARSPTLPHRPRVNKPYKKVAQEIRHLQRTTQLLLRKLPFYRLVREIAKRLNPGVDYRWQLLGLEALQGRRYFKNHDVRGFLNVIYDFKSS